MEKIYAFVTIGDSIKTTKRAQTNNFGHFLASDLDDVQFWKNHGPLVSGGVRTILVDFAPAIEVPSSESLSKKAKMLGAGRIFISKLVCIEGDAAGYGWAVKVKNGNLECWLDDTQVCFATSMKAQKKMWSIAGKAMKEAGVYERKGR